MGWVIILRSTEPKPGKGLEKSNTAGHGLKSDRVKTSKPVWLLVKLYVNGKQGRAKATNPSRKVTQGRKVDTKTGNNKGART